MKDPSVILNSFNVLLDSEGRYNLNDLHKSAFEGANATKSQRPGAFLQSAQVSVLFKNWPVQQLLRQFGRATVVKILAIGGIELVAIRYAAWIEPKFEIQFYNTFVEAKRQKALDEINRNTAHLEYKPMTDAIKHDRDAQGKTIAHHHFSNEADLINPRVSQSPKKKYKFKTKKKSGCSYFVRLCMY